MNSNQKPLVSVICTTYNHEKYIEDAIKSFLSQETSFPYEIIIHDDASTDGTRAIVSHYTKNYPNIIVPILQTENQYSKGVSILNNFLIPKVRGDYVARCEGDDYWSDKHKLQKQVDFLSNNDEYVACFHKVRVVDTNKIPLGQVLGKSIKDSREITIREAVVGGVIHLSSWLVRSLYFKAKRPPWYKLAIHGDYAGVLFLAAEGRIFFLNEIMSHYRQGVENSMMTNFKKNYTIENDIKYNLNRIKVLEAADKYYNYKHTNDIASVVLFSKVHILLLNKDFSFKAWKIYFTFITDWGIISFIKQIILLNDKIARFFIKIKYSFQRL